MVAFFRHFLVLSLLFASMESATDTIVDGVPHGDEASHQTEFGHALDAHDGSVPDSELDGEHCEHCCHSHCSAINPQSMSGIASIVVDHCCIANHPQVLRLAQAPPTPPPNA